MNRYSLFEKLIVLIVPLGLLHHSDHVFRADHSGWPFRPEVTLFTFTLLIYPFLALAYYMGSRPWVRVGIISTIAFFTLIAHTLIEPPDQIYGTWANNLSTDAPLYTVSPEHRHNLLNDEYRFIGVVAAVLSIVLTALLVIASIVAIRDALRYKRGRFPT
jgi:hypothetical protein